MPRLLSLNQVFPFLRWWSRVDRTTLRADGIAGLIGAIIVLPQGVAFATLAGMPPEYGLYAAMVPAVVAAFFGSSWHLVSGPTNAISLVVFATLSQLAEPGSVKYVGLALTLTFMVGAMQLAMGLARLGALVNFISHTVVVGFTTGAAILIMTSQVRNFFGVSIERGSSFLQTFQQFFGHLEAINPWVLTVAMVTLGSGIAVRRRWPKIPYMIAAMLAGSLLAEVLNVAFGQDMTGIRTLGALPAALPALSAPSFDTATWGRLLGIAVAVTALGLTEAVSIARSIAVRSGQRIDGNQEFIGQGLSNLVGSFFSAYPASGSFNRSGANYEAGAQTPLAAAVSAVVLVVILLAVAPLMAYLPIAAMAGILMLVAWGLLDFHSIGTVFKSSRSETGVLIVTTLATLFMHLEMAIVAGVMMSLLLYLNRTARPSIRSILPDPEHPQRRLGVRRPGAPECPQLKILRIEGDLYFGAVNHIAEYLQYQAERAPEQKHLLVMSKSMNFIDVAGAEMWANEGKRRQALGGGLYFNAMREEAERMMTKPPFQPYVGAIFHGKTEAIAGCFERLDPEVCRGCTVRVFRECGVAPADQPPALLVGTPVACVDAEPQTA